MKTPNLPTIANTTIKDMPPELLADLMDLHPQLNPICRPIETNTVLKAPPYTLNRLLFPIVALLNATRDDRDHYEIREEPYFPPEKYWEATVTVGGGDRWAMHWLHEKFGQEQGSLLRFRVDTSGCKELSGLLGSGDFVVELPPDSHLAVECQKDAEEEALVAEVDRIVKHLTNEIDRRKDNLNHAGVAEAIESTVEVDVPGTSKG